MRTAQPAGQTILGLDPGTAATGFGIVRRRGSRLEAVEFGVIRTPSDMGLEHRLAIIFDGVSTLTARHVPDVAAVESLFFNVNAQTAFAVGQARGVVLLALSRAGCEVCEFTPQQVKSAVAGYGKADKRQIQEMVRRLLGLEVIPRPDHVADALGVAICAANGIGFRSGLRQALAGRGRDASDAARRERGTSD